MRMMGIGMIIGCGMIIISGCISVNLPQSVTASLLPADTSFIISGQAEAAVDPQTFPVWRGDDGQAFVLFQTTNIKNDDFDNITTPGNRSRLLLSVRNDLAPLCQPDVTPVEVTQVLEINDVDMNQGR